MSPERDLLINFVNHDFDKNLEKYFKEKLQNPRDLYAKIKLSVNKNAAIVQSYVNRSNLSTLRTTNNIIFQSGMTLVCWKAVVVIDHDCYPFGHH